MIEKCNSTHARNHRKARQAHMKKMVRNEDAFTQSFRTAKGVRTRFFFVAKLSDKGYVRVSEILRANILLYVDFTNI